MVHWWWASSAVAAPCPEVTSALCKDLQAQLGSAREQAGTRTQGTGAEVKLPWLGGIGVGGTHTSEVTTQTVTLSQERIDALGDAVNACSAALRAPSPYTVELFWKRFAANVMGDASFACSAGAVAEPPPPVRARDAARLQMLDGGSYLPELLIGQSATSWFEMTDGTPVTEHGVTFVSSAPAVFTVDALGRLTPVAVGYGWVRAAVSGATVFEIPVAVGRQQEGLRSVVAEGTPWDYPVPAGRRSLTLRASAVDGGKDGIAVEVPPACRGGGFLVDPDPLQGDRLATVACASSVPSRLRVTNPGDGAGPGVSVDLRLIETPPTSTRITSPTSAPTADGLRPFVGKWYVGGPGQRFDLEVRPDGLGSMLRDGVTAQIRIGQVVGNVAYAVIEQTTDRERLPSQPFLLSRDDRFAQAIYMGAWQRPVILCSARTAELAPDDVVARCGR